MARTATITLDEKQYVVHAFNMKELQEVGEILKGGANITVGMDIVAVALRRADPPVTDVWSIEPTLTEINQATSAILKLAGIETETPQLAAPATS